MGIHGSGSIAVRLPCEGSDYVSMERSITLDVNGATHPLVVHHDEPLALALRNRLGLTGLKLGCSLEQCGACAVLVDGASTLTCVRPAADFDGRRIETVEGLGTPESPGAGATGAARRGRRAVRVLHAGAGGRDYRAAAREPASGRRHGPVRARAPPVPVRRPSARAAGGTEARRGGFTMNACPGLVPRPCRNGDSPRAPQAAWELAAEGSR